MHFVEDKIRKKKRRSRVGEGSSNITMKLKYIIIISWGGWGGGGRCPLLDQLLVVLGEILESPSIAMSMRYTAAELDLLSTNVISG